MQVYRKTDVTNKLWLLEPEDFIAYFEELAGEWNGDESGRQEERAHIASDIIVLLKELQEA